MRIAMTDSRWLREMMYPRKKLLARVTRFVNGKLGVSWLPNKRFHNQAADEPYLDLSEMGIHDNVDLAKSAELVKPSPRSRNVLLVQPIHKNLPKTTMKTTTELQVQEAHALVSTMRSRLRVVDTLCLNTTSERKKLFFGKGNFREIQENVQKFERKLGNLTVFLNVNMLTPMQHCSLNAALGVDIYDRFMLVLQIFKHHARTREAKLQTSLAEIPYYRARMNFFGNEKMLVQLGQREVALKRGLEELRAHRAVLRQQRQRHEVPVVAVVGYTNAGKTSLIKKLTDSQTLTPRNQLFATLDVTCHEARLPMLGKVLYVDTVGFISDIPTELIGSFRATLEDALLADCIVHIYDLSHPDLENQCETVMETLRGIETPRRLMDTMIHLGNKADLVEDPDAVVARAEKVLGSCLPISSVTAEGIRDALQLIQGTLIENTKRGSMRIRCRMGSSEYVEIYRKSDAVLNVVPDDNDENFAFLEVTVTATNLQKLRAKFRENPSVEIL